MEIEKPSEQKEKKIGFIRKKKQELLKKKNQKRRAKRQKKDKILNEENFFSKFQEKIETARNKYDQDLAFYIIQILKESNVFNVFIIFIYKLLNLEGSHKKYC